MPALQFKGFITVFLSALTCIKLHLCRLIGVIAKCGTFRWGGGVATGAKELLESFRHKWKQEEI